MNAYQKEDSVMKLIYAIVNRCDSRTVANALSKEGFFSTKLASTGNFLMTGNTTFFIATEDDKVDKAIEVIKAHSQKRTQTIPSATIGDTGVSFSTPVEITVGGATIIVTDIDRFEKI